MDHNTPAAVEGTPGAPDRSGDDVLFTGKAGGTLDGGAGYDRAYVVGGFGDYRFETDPATGETVVTRVTSANGHEAGTQTRLVNIEALDIGGVSLPAQGWSLADGELFGTAGVDVLDVHDGYDGVHLQVSADGQAVHIEWPDGRGLWVRGVEQLQFRDLLVVVADEARAGPTQHRWTSGDDVLLGNERGYTLQGLDGDDTLTGMGGDDRLYGGKGQDEAVYRGLRADYQVERIPGIGQVRVTDSVAGRDGVDLLLDIEHLRFADGVFDTEQLAPPLPDTAPVDRAMGIVFGAMATDAGPVDLLGLMPYDTTASGALP